VVWFSITLTQHIDYFSGGSRIHTYTQPTHTHFSFPSDLLHISQSHSLFHLPYKVFPALHHILHHFLALFFSIFPFSGVKAQRLKFTLKRKPPPSQPQPLYHRTITVTLLRFQRNEVRHKAHICRSVYCRLYCSYKQFSL